MTALLTLKGRQVAYELTWKQVKNINIRVRSDGTVGVSAPRWVTRAQVEEVLQARGDFILGALDKFAALDRPPVREHTYAQGELVWLLGQQIPLRLEQGPKNRAFLAEGALVLQVRDPDNGALRKKTAESFYRDTCLALVTELCRNAHPQLAPLGVPFPEIRVRSMTSRWGSCKPSGPKVTFAWQLVKAPLDCVEYVVWHELCHFIHPDHSPAFHARLARYIPDWKARRKTLNQPRP